MSLTLFIFFSLIWGLFYSVGYSLKYYFLKLESTQKDRSRYQLWLFFTKISFKQLHEERFEYFQVSNS